MANQESITQAAATSEYFTMVILRRPVRLQTRIAEKTRRGGWLTIRLGKACPDELRVGRETYVKDWVHLAVGKDAAMCGS